jgi:hypothetical protein
MKMGMVRKLPEDDSMHEPEDAPDFNESAYYNFGDTTQDVGGLLRLGNRVNEGYAEMTTCLFLPGGSVAFWYERPAITDNRAHDAGGLRFDVIEAHTEHRVRYNGPVLFLEDPSQMEDPGKAFKSNPHVRCDVDLTLRAVADPFWPWVKAGDGSSETTDGDEAFDAALHAGFARNHLNQHMTVGGTVRVDDRQFVIESGLGWRDRSWGPRSWQRIPWYRWTSCSFGPDMGIAIIVFGDEDGNSHPRGYVHHGMDRQPSRIVRGHFDTDYDHRWYARTVKLSVETEDGAKYELVGDVWSHIPLRFRRHDQVTRVTEGMTRWRCEGRLGLGVLEYLDQMVDGRPVGVEATAAAR